MLTELALADRERERGLNATDLAAGGSPVRSHPTSQLAHPLHHTDGMGIRMFIARGRHFHNYAVLRDTLDALLANRLPDVELLTAGGCGVPMLAASYATEHSLKLTALVPDFRRFPVDAPERRDAFLVEQADAAVVVWDDRDPAVRRVLALVERKGIPVYVLGAPAKLKAR